ncbi:Cercosporin MFS transporter ctb4 [Vermiconidia calcicola]|uniref:Cercosporin MFS transporter ctb4 n=1 Tax=Vermiconidia calcicola TaxID=1690605 RepID=A0ACC3NBI9_9PEZI|nr:Cercosporin MFS transporter ctb4 [Vermiconidia calcicola]
MADRSYGTLDIVKSPRISSASVSATPSQSSLSGDGLDELILATIRSDTFVVDWYGPDDKGDPQNLPSTRKWLITVSLALYALVTTFASSVFGAATRVVAKELDLSIETVVFGCTSFYMMGFALGPILWGPLSECFGRRGPLMAGFLAFIVTQLPVIDARGPITIFGFRFLQGFFGSAPSSILSGTLADIWTPKQRGFAMPAVGSFLTIGPILGPLIGSLLVDSSLGWRGIEIVTVTLSISVAVVTFPLLSETYPPLLLSQRAQLLRQMTHNWALRARHEEIQSNFRDFAERYLLRPVRMLALEPILLLFTLYISVSFGLLYNFFLAYPASFVQERGWDSTSASLPLLSILAGVMLAGALISATTSSWLSPNPEEGRPQETRLILMMAGAVSLPVGMFWFAFTSSASSNPWPQIASGIPTGFGIHVINMQGMNYIIDCYGIHSNSAIAANTFLRSLFAAGIPLLAASMYSSIGVKWVTALLGLLAVALAPVPFLFFIFGESIRAKSRWAPQT